MKEGYYQPEPEFIDFVFNSKITHSPMLTTETHSSRHHQSSSAYTNKLNRRRLNQHKLPNFEDIFAQNTNQLQQMAPENTPLAQHSKGQMHHHRPLTDTSQL